MAVQVAQLRQGNARYPAGLRQSFGAGVASPAVVGNADLLVHKAVALFCSIECPGDLILKTYDLARALMDAAIPAIGGFHSPMEKECLTPTR